MAKIGITVSIPHKAKEYNVQVPDAATGKKLYEALLKRSNLQEGDAVSYELFQKRVGKKVYPDLADQTLQQIGIREGDTIIMKKDMDPGAISNYTLLIIKLLVWKKHLS